MNSSRGSSSNNKRSIKLSHPISKAEFDESKSELFPVNLPMSSEGDSEIINTLRQKLSEAEHTIKELEAMKHRLAISLASRDEEFIRLTKLVNSSKFEGSTDLMNTGSYTDSRTEQILLTNQANKRIIDQLNSQIDFLNEQLAIREDQVVKTADASHELYALQQDHKQAIAHLDDLKRVNSKLVVQVQALEKKLLELDQALDPDGEITVDELVYGSSQLLAEEKPISSSDDAAKKNKTYPLRNAKANNLYAKKNLTAPASSKPVSSTRLSSKATTAASVKVDGKTSLSYLSTTIRSSFYLVYSQV
jgi:hypothetical protein